MVWNDRLSVGVAVIDEDHKKLLGLTNELYDAIVDRRGKEVLGRILDDLVDYTTFHFAREEQLFSQIGYQFAAEHKKIHDELIRQVTEIQGRYRNGSPALTLEVMDFLKSWLFDHILGSDAKYAPSFKAKGIC
jgi:hemerythrin-like metal-binding protein